MENIEDLDLSWIHEFEKIDNEYKNYYTEDLQFISIHSIYINKDNSIEKIKEEKIMFKTLGILQKEELLRIIKNNVCSNGIKYSLLSILKFNINIEPENLKTFLRSKNENIGNTFLHSIKNIDSIKFDKSISLFHDINDLIIIFHQKNKNLPSFTKKIYIQTISNKKTKRKLFKESI
uniref:Uncharacterized protein n=1 Tax=viral metagenome TaxID=1070528 RepID=A0A6C0KRE0_9ZZZZ